MADKLNDIAKGVADSWDAYLADRPISTVDAIERAVENATRLWLAEHTDELIAAIADRKSGDV